MPRCWPARSSSSWDNIKPEHRDAAREALARMNEKPASNSCGYSRSTTLPITLRAAMSLSAFAASASG